MTEILYQDKRMDSKISVLKISEIKISDNRRSVGDISELAASIKELGLLNPITVNFDNTLIAGHHRIEAFKFLGLDEIPAIMLDLKAIDAELAEIDENLIRNELTQLQNGRELARRKALYLMKYPETGKGSKGGWHNNKTDKLENDTVSFSSDTATKTGKSKRTTERQVSIGETLPKELDADLEQAGLADSQKDLLELSKLQKKAPEQVKEVLETIKNGEASTVKGALLKKESAKKAASTSASIAHNKPVLKELHYQDFLKQIEDRSVDLLITDPPYSTDVIDIHEFVDDWLKPALDKIKDGGRAYICIGAYPEELNAYMSRLLQQDRFIVDNPLIWTYRNTLGVTPKFKYNLNYQFVIHLYQDTSAELDTSVTNEMFSVQDINAPDGRFGDRYHAWQKPEELGLRLIKHATKEGDLVIDPFACTGTFSICASKLNRRSIGCDISSEHLKIAASRGCHVEFR